MTIVDRPYELASLTEHLVGDVVLPGDPGWDAARQAYNLTIDQQPAAVLFPVDERDIQTVVRYAAAHGLTVAPQRTGHNAGPLGSLDDVILLKTDRLDTVEIDPEGLRARVGSGVKWASVVPRLSDLGLAALHGSTPDVSIAGYGLGGGVGWYGRKHGLFASSITAIELVTADGRLRRVDHEHEPDLFWALRGGGGNFGVVTALEFRLFPISEVYAGVLFFPWERSAEVLHAWHAWTATVPDEMTSVGRLLRFPPLEDIPEPLRGNSFAIVEAFFVGSAEEGDALLEPLRRLGPVMDTVAMVPPVGLSEIHMDPPDPVPYQGDGIVLGDLPPSAIDDLIAVAGPESGSTLVSVEVRHTGGALGRGGEGHGALDRLQGSFLAFAVGMVMDEATAAATRADLSRVIGSLCPHHAGAYLNFEEQKTETSGFWTAASYRRLQEVRAAVDPGELFRANHVIPPAE